MEYLLCPNNHLFVAYAAAKKIAEIPISFAYWVRNLSSLIFLRVFLHTIRGGQKIDMRPQFVPNARPHDESIQLVPRALR